MGEYDHAMKVLVDADPLAIARFVLGQSERTRHLAEADSGLTFIAQLGTEFPGTEARADGLLRLETGLGEPFFLHIEFQSKRDPTMGDRLIDYDGRIRHQHGLLPIVACVIYLRPDGVIEESPHTWPSLGGSVNLIFEYVCIKLWEVPRQEILDLHQPALLPLSLLTKWDVDRILIKDMFEALLTSKLYDLLPIGQTIAGWLFQGMDLEWLRKEYHKMLDFFKDSPAYEWMTEDARKEGLEQGRQEARQQILEAQKRAQKTLETFQQTVVALVAERFPELVGIARKQVSSVKDLEHLQQVILRVSLSKDAAEAARALAELDEDAES